MPHLARSFLPSVLLTLALSVAPLHADVIDFETLPNAYMYFGGSQNIGTFYSGIDLESNVTGLDLTGSTGFPPHSGSIVVWDAVDASVTISFTAPQTNVGLWYTSLDPMAFAAFDGPGGAGTLIGSQLGAANTDGTTGTSDFLSISAADISSVTLTGIPGDFVFDDLTFTPAGTSAVPEPSTFVLLLSLLLPGFALARRPGRV